MAVHLVNDAHGGKFQTAVVVSNDSDLAGAIEIVTQELGLCVGIINPSSVHFNKQLSRYAAFKKPVRVKAAMASQFAGTLTDGVGKFSRPPSW